MDTIAAINLLEKKVTCLSERIDALVGYGKYLKKPENYLNFWCGNSMAFERELHGILVNMKSGDRIILCDPTRVEKEFVLFLR